MTPAHPADLRAPALVARALTADDTAGVLRTLREARGIEARALSAALLENASSRMRRDPRLAFWLAREAIRCAERSKDPASAARGAYYAGLALASQSRMRGGLRLLERAISGFHRIGNRREVAAALVARIQPLAYLGRYEEAQAAGDAALRLFRDLGETGRLVETENALGDLAYRQDRYREALEHFRRALALVTPDARPRGVAVLEMNFANCLEALGRYAAAKRYFDRARALFEKEGLRHTVAMLDQNRAYFALLRGRYAESLELYERAAAAYGELGDTRDLGPVHLELAELYLLMGMAGEARVLARTAAARLDREGFAKESAQALFFVGVAELVEGDSAAAGCAFEEARVRFARQDNAVWVAECDLLRAHVLVASGSDERAARRLAQAARRAFNATSRSARAASAEILLARIDLAAKRPVRAIARLDQAAERTRRLDAPWLRAEIRRFEGLALLALGQADRGIEALEAAVEIVESHRGAVPSDEFMVSFLASKAAVYEETVLALVDAGRPVQAFEYAERAKSRALVDMLAARGERRPAAPRGGLDLSAGKVQRLREELNALYGRLRRVAAGIEREDAARVGSLRRDIASREAELSRLSRDAWAKDPEFASLSAVRPLGLESVRALLDAETTLVEYFVTPARTVAFVVGRDAFAARTIDVAESEFARRAQRFRFHVARFQLKDGAAGPGASLHQAATRANLAELAQALVAPIADLLVTRRVVVAAHGTLHAVPFHALPWDEGWLCDRFDVSYVPNAAVYGFCAAKKGRASGPAAVFSLPDEAAPRIADEAREVAAALGEGTRLFCGAEATSARLREAACDARVLHLATHGMFRPDHPTLSSVRLADTWLNLYDVYGLDIRSDLVVLSACESGAAGIGRGDEALGLLRGFLYAGAPRLLASRWCVNDGTAALFMCTFHGALREGSSFEEAARRATATVRERFPHPYHWAAFALVGDARGGLVRVPSSLERPGV